MEQHAVLVEVPVDGHMDAITLLGELSGVLTEARGRLEALLAGPPTGLPEQRTSRSVDVAGARP